STGRSSPMNFDGFSATITAFQSACVTSYLPMEKAFTWTRRCGPSALVRPGSFSGEPIRNDPAGAPTISNFTPFRLSVKDCPAMGGLLVAGLGDVADFVNRQTANAITNALAAPNINNLTDRRFCGRGVTGRGRRETGMIGLRLGGRMVMMGGSHRSGGSPFCIGLFGSVRSGISLIGTQLFVSCLNGIYFIG